MGRKIEEFMRDFLCLGRKGEKMEKKRVKYKYVVGSGGDIEWGIRVERVGWEGIGGK